MKKETLMILAVVLLVNIGTFMFFVFSEKFSSESYSGVKSYEMSEDVDSKNTIVTNVTFENGVPVDLNIDVREENGVMRYDLSKSGKYKMDKKANKPWHEQIDMLETAIKMTDFDLNTIHIYDKEGHTDAVSGVSIKVKSFVDSVKNALAEL